MRYKYFEKPKRKKKRKTKVAKPKPLYIPFTKRDSHIFREHIKMLKKNKKAIKQIGKRKKQYKVWERPGMHHSKYKDQNCSLMKLSLFPIQH